MDNNVGKDIELIEYNSKYKEQLNLWQGIEKEQGKNGLNRFVVPLDTNLGDFLEYVSKEMNMDVKLAVLNNEIVGFVSYEIKEENSAHIEIIGTNPNFRKQGIAKRILFKLKEILKQKEIERLTLAVNKKNKTGISAFSKFAKESINYNSENYIGFEL